MLHFFPIELVVFFLRPPEVRRQARTQSPGGVTSWRDMRRSVAQTMLLKGIIVQHLEFPDSLDALVVALKG